MCHGLDMPHDSPVHSLLEPVSRPSLGFGSGMCSGINSEFWFQFHLGFYPGFLCGFCWQRFQRRFRFLTSDPARILVKVLEWVVVKLNFQQTHLNVWNRAQLTLTVVWKTRGLLQAKCDRGDCSRKSTQKTKKFSQHAKNNLLSYFRRSQKHFCRFSNTHEYNKQNGHEQANEIQVQDFHKS